MILNWVAFLFYVTSAQLYHDMMYLAASNTIRLIINCYFVKIAAVILSVINRNTGETLAFMKLQEKLQSNEKQEFSWV